VAREDCGVRRRRWSAETSSTLSNAVSPSRERRQFGLDHFGLLVNDVYAAVEMLRGRGAVIDTEPFDFMPGSRLAFVRGPGNVRVELTQRG
jgi:catechol 2,3-dioxygenase-like lactoylglutathione lyase family enzyme